MATQDWDTELDLLVVGSGAAGLTAAVVGANEGLSVAVLEKTPYFGGTSALSGGVVWIPNNPLMLEAGIEDSPQQALTYLKHNIGNRVASAKLEAFISQAPRMVEYLLANSRMAFQITHGFPDYRPETPGGCQGGRSIDPKVVAGVELGETLNELRAATTVVPLGIVGSVTELRRLAFFKTNPLGLLKVWRVVPRNIWNKLAGRKHIAGGRALVARLRLSLSDKQVPLWLNTPLEALIEEGGKVVGASIIKDGVRQRIRVRKGVVIAAGGFEHNIAMRKQFFGEQATSDWSSGSDGNMGDGIKVGEALGAATDLMDDLWWMPSAMPPGKPPIIIVFERGLPHMVMVNAAGKRFANEAKPYNELGRDIFEEADQPIYIVFDDSYRNKYSIVGMLPGITPATYIDNGFVKRAETIEALSEQTGIDQAGLAATILRFNEMANAGRDEDFHKGESAFDLYAGDASHQPNPCLGPIATAPFYAIRVFPGDLGSKGGLLINEHAQVQRPDGSIIEGLYAVGNSSASVMGNFYPGAGGTIGPAMTFGYIAALSAAARE